MGRWQKVLVPVLTALTLLSCGGGDPGGSDDPSAWVSIRTPDGTTTTTYSWIDLEGNAWIPGESSPGLVVTVATPTWSGTAPSGVTCMVMCPAWWQRSVPLAIGENAITVTASANGSQFAAGSITITRQ